MPTFRVLLYDNGQMEPFAYHDRRSVSKEGR